MVSQDHELIADIYDTVADVGLWPDVLDRIAESVGARGAMLFEIDNATLTGTHLAKAYRRDVLEHYLREYLAEEMADHQSFLTHIRDNDTVDIVPDTILYDDIAEFRQRPNIQATLDVGLLHRAAAVLNKDNMDIGRFSIQFGADRGPITEAEAAVLNRLLPHVAKAFHLGHPVHQLSAQSQKLLAAIDRLSVGLCLLDGTGNVVVANQEFGRQIQDYPVFEITPQGALRFLLAQNQKSFEALKSAAVHHGRFGARPRKEAIPVDDDAFLCIEVAPVGQLSELSDAGFGGYLVYSTDTSRPISCNTALIQRAFDLTAAETGLIGEIGQGLTNSQIAQRRERSVDTINAQVKAILNKSGCANRTQFVRLMMSFGTPLVLE